MLRGASPWFGRRPDLSSGKYDGIGGKRNDNRRIGVEEGHDIGAFHVPRNNNNNENSNYDNSNNNITDNVNDMPTAGTAL